MTQYGGNAQQSDDLKPCPYCAEWIKVQAVKCRFCKSDLDGSTPRRQTRHLPRSLGRAPTSEYDDTPVVHADFSNRYANLSNDRAQPSFRGTASNAVGIGSGLLSAMLMFGVFLAVWVVGPAALVLMPILGIPLYFIPSIVAMIGGKRGAGGIFLLNLLLGWTVIGWIIALIWAVSAESSKR